MRGLILLPFAILPLAAPLPLSAEPPPEIRVCIIASAPAVAIEGLGSALRIEADSGKANERIGARAELVAGRSGIALRGREIGARVAISAPSRRYRIGSNILKGDILAVWLSPGKLMVVAKLPLEDYLAGLINSEISSSWPEEAVKAQAVAARSYAMNQIEATRRAVPPRDYDITATVLDQVYEGAHREDAASREAVAATRGEVLLRGGALFSAYYHSCCGGQTELASNVWPGEEGPPPVEDRHCTRSPKLTWSWRAPISKFIEAMRGGGVPLNAVRSVATTALPDSPRAGELLIEDDDGLKIVKATELRRILGYQDMRSTWLEAAIEGRDVVFTGRGYGHGVGLCQWGAKGMAEEGFNYRDILKFYYPDAEAVRLH